MEKRHEASINSIDQDKVKKAVEYLRIKVYPEGPEIRSAVEDNPDEWWIPHHFFFGMWVRNTLRSGGFDEKFFDIHNLDDIWVPLLEKAVEFDPDISRPVVESRKIEEDEIIKLDEKHLEDLNKGTGVDDVGEDDLGK